MKKRVLALVLTMSLAGSSLLPVNAMEAGEKSFDDNPGQEQQIEEEGEQPAETDGEKEEKMEGNAPGSEEDESDGQGNQEIIEDDQENTDEPVQEEESGESDFAWEVSQEQIRILNGGKAYFYVSSSMETDDGDQIQAESSDESAVTVEAVSSENVSPELAAEAPENAVWYEVTAVNTGEYAVIITFRGEEKQIAVYVESPALLQQNGMEQIQTADNAEMDTAAPQVQAVTEAGWSEDGLYYTNEDGSLCKGIAEIEGVLYYFDESTGELCKEARWIDKDDRQYFCNSEGILYQDQFIKFGDTYYYMGSDGSVQKGFVTASDGNSYYADTGTGVIQKSTWIEDGEDRYFADASGKLYRDQFIKFDDTYYYMGSDGSVQKGFVSTSDGSRYYADPATGVIWKSSWIEAGEDRYFADASGKLYRDQFIKFGNIYYYMGTDGSVQKGVVKAADGCYYNLDENTGVLQKKADWVYANDKEYFSDANGKLYQNQFIKFGNTYYYMGADASVQKGIVKAADGCYYNLDENTGILQKKADWVYANDKEYFSDANGKLYQNQFIKFGDTYYYMGADASVQKGIVKAADGKYYYTDEISGILQKKAGWIDKGDKRYFSDVNGILYSNQFIKFGDIYYYCGNDAAIVKSQTVPVNGVLYKFDADGIMVKEGGWGTYNGNRYYKNPATGFPYQGWVTFGDTWYYANGNGIMVSGWQTINGYRYYFYTDTYTMARDTVISGIYVGIDGKASRAYTYAVDILNQVGWNLKAVFDWCVGLRYIHMTEEPTPGSEWFALYGFENGRGNCYVMAATFYYLAKALGYDAHQVAGYVMSVGGNSPHSWVEINIGGKLYVFDVSFENGNRGNGYYFTYGTPGTWRYTDYYRMN